MDLPLTSREGWGLCYRGQGCKKGEEEERFVSRETCLKRMCERGCCPFPPAMLTVRSHQSLLRVLGGCPTGGSCRLLPSRIFTVLKTVLGPLPRVGTGKMAGLGAEGEGGSWKNLTCIALGFGALETRTCLFSGKL